MIAISRFQDQPRDHPLGGDAAEKQLVDSYLRDGEQRQLTLPSIAALTRISLRPLFKCIRPVNRLPIVTPYRRPILTPWR